MSDRKKTDSERLAAIQSLVGVASENNIGDLLTDALIVASDISDENVRHDAEYAIAQLRIIARNAEIGWRILMSPPKTAHVVTDDEALRLMNLVGVLHSFCYGAERLDEASFVAGPDSTPVRFYINSLYQYIGALYLIDKGKLPMGGTAYKLLYPMGLAILLKPIQNVLDEPLGGGLTFGETVKRIRNKFIVHGTFSPDDIASVVKQAGLRKRDQMLRLTKFIWDLYNQSLILKLSLIAVLTDSHIDIDHLVKNMLSKE